MKILKIMLSALLTIGIMMPLLAQNDPPPIVPHNKKYNQHHNFLTSVVPNGASSTMIGIDSILAGDTCITWTSSILANGSTQYESFFNPNCKGSGNVSGDDTYWKPRWIEARDVDTCYQWHLIDSFRNGTYTVTDTIFENAEICEDAIFDNNCVLGSKVNKVEYTSTDTVTTYYFIDYVNCEYDSVVSFKSVQVIDHNDLCITKTLIDDSFSVNDTISFKLEVNNKGSLNEPSAEVIDQLGNNLIFVDATCPYNSVTGLWDIGAINSQATEVCTIRAQVLTQDLYNSAIVCGELLDPKLQNNFSTVSFFSLIPPVAKVQLSDVDFTNNSFTALFDLTQSGGALKTGECFDLIVDTISRNGDVGLFETINGLIGNGSSTYNTTQTDISKSIISHSFGIVAHNEIITTNSFNFATANNLIGKGVKLRYTIMVGESCLGNASSLLPKSINLDNDDETCVVEHDAFDNDQFTSNQLTGAPNYTYSLLGGTGTIVGHDTIGGSVPPPPNPSFPTLSDLVAGPLTAGSGCGTDPYLRIYDIYYFDNGSSHSDVEIEFVKIGGVQYEINEVIPALNGSWRITPLEMLTAINNSPFLPCTYELEVLSDAYLTDCDERIGDYSSLKSVTLAPV